MPYGPAHQLSQAVPHTASLRVNSIDILRGLVMVVMALDHVREFWSATPYRPEDLSQTSVFLFFTRWVTHFCAPTFVFLSGISVFLYGQNRGSRRKLSTFLLTRGLWLILLEILVINFFWQFGYQLILIQVIWVIGWSMILLAGLIWLPRWVLALLVLGMIAGHNLLPPIQPVTEANVGLAILHNTPFFLQAAPLPPILVAYTLVPWVGVMAAGYLMGPWFTYPVPERKRLLQLAGGGLLLIFVVLRALNGYGDPAQWSTQPRGVSYTVLSFLNVSKYPPSLLFLCLTLGVALLLLAAFEEAANRVLEWLRTFGRVPFFFYLLHIPLISGTALLWTYFTFGKVTNFSFSPVTDWPREYEPNLLRAYLVWLLIILTLYLPCRWYSRFRKEHDYWWFSYL